MYSTASANTYFQWIGPKDDIFQGKCFELDQATNGQKYRDIVKPHFCKTDDIILVFYAKKGLCYQLDEKTKGLEYLEKVNTEECRPEKTNYYQGVINERFHCYEVDSATQGKNYFNKVKDKLCTSKDSVEYLWQAKSKLEGKCYTKGKDGSLKKIKDKYCRPGTVSYKFVRKDSFKGDCYEQDIDDSRKYSIKVRSEKCKTEKTIFIFYQNEENKKGECYELDEKTKGNNYLATVPFKFCKESL